MTGMNGNANDDELISDAEMIRLENAEAKPGLVKVLATLAEVVLDVLEPTRYAAAGTDGTDGEPERLQACSHMFDLRSRRRTSEGRAVSEPSSRNTTIFLCPMHPHGDDRGTVLFCDKDYAAHYDEEHHGEFDRAACFACEAPMRDPLTGLYRPDFTPVFAEVALNEPVPIRFTMTVPDRTVQRDDFSYVGNLVTLPCAYLCPRHANAMPEPMRSSWPMCDRLPA